MGSHNDPINRLYAAYADKARFQALLTQTRQQVVSWRWATASMSFHAPFARELYGGPAPRWLADDQARPAEHVHHGLDAQGRIVLELEGQRREQVLLHEAGHCTAIGWYAHGIDNVRLNRYAGGRLVADHLHAGQRGIDTEHVWDAEGRHLLRSVSRNWRDCEPTWSSQYAYGYADDDRLSRIDLQYLDAHDQPKPGHDRLMYLRLPKGETLKTVEARVQALLQQALPAALGRIPRDVPLYALFLCFTHEDVPAAWPPFLVWGTESYRQQVVAAGEEVPHDLWAPDEIRGDGADHELWFDGPEHQALREACLLHSQLMGMRHSDASAMRVLKAVVPELEVLARQTGLLLTADFVALMADNTGDIDPLKALKARLTPERWAQLASRGWV